MRKITGLFLAMVMVLCSLVSYGALGETALTGNLTLASNEDSVAIWNQIAAKFSEQYPGVTVEVAPFIDYTALNQNVMAAHQASDDYDLVTVNHVDTLSFIKGELLLPMNDLMANANVDFDAIIMGNLEDMGKLGDTVYTVPIDTDTRVMLVNTDLFAKYNLAVPATMDEMLAAGKVISQANQGDYVFTDEMCTNGDYFSTYEAGIFLQSCGGKLYTVDANGVATATVDTPEMRAYLTFITELLPYMPEDCTTNNDARSAFLEGNIGMYTFGPWEFLQMDLDALPFAHELTLVPAGSAGSVSTSGGFQLGIGSGTKNPELALAFVNFLVNDEESMALIGSTGLPTIESAYQSGTFADAKYKVFMEQLGSSNLPQTPVANLGEVVACFTGYWNDMCAGNISVDEVIQGAQPAVQALLDENN